MGSRRTWIRLAAASASGVMVALLFPPFDVSSLVWLAFIPLLSVLWSLEGKRKARQGFLIGGLAGLVSCGIQFHWFGVVSWLAAILMPLYLALYWGAFGAFAATLGRPQDETEAERDTLDRILHSLRIGFCTAAVWAGLEWFRSWFLTGFGWNPIGVAFHQTHVMAQAADLLGVNGLSMVPLFLQAVLLQTGRRMMHGARCGKRQTRLDFGIAALMVAVLVCYGLIRISFETAKPHHRLKTMLVQLNVPQHMTRVLWEPFQLHQAYETETLNGLDRIIEEDAKRMEAMIENGQTEAAINTRWPDWVMWPEAALSGHILVAEDGSHALWQNVENTIDVVQSAGSFQLLFGITEFEGEMDPVNQGMMLPKLHGRGWNSLARMGPDGMLETYRKHHLVIFGETIPFVDSLPWLKEIYEKQAGAEFGGSFTPGDSLEPMLVPLADGTVIHSIPTVCFEDTVPRLTRHFLRNEPQVIVNVTNDGWFKQSPAAAQHFANARFRAIEFRRPMLRCANNGVSAAIDATGSVAHPTTGKPQMIADANGSHFTRGSLLTELKIPIQPSLTLYAIIGDWGVIGISLFALAIAWLRRSPPEAGDGRIADKRLRDRRPERRLGEND